MAREITQDQLKMENPPIPQEIQPFPNVCQSSNKASQRLGKQKNSSKTTGFTLRTLRYADYPPILQNEVF